MSKKTEHPVIVWFRQDLRLADNPALTAAAETGHPVLPVYFLDDGNAGDWRMGTASRQWLHRSLASLNESLGGRLRYFRGDAAQILTQLVRDLGAAGMYWNCCYKPWRIARDRRIKAVLEKSGCCAQNHRADCNRPDLENVSRLLPHLGEISPHRVWHTANALRAAEGPEKDIDHHLSEIGWREFAHYLLYHWPRLPRYNVRIFNPVTQGRKFDLRGVYVRRFIPELGRLPNNYLHGPWEAPAGALAEAGITLGTDYPHPMVDLKTSRQRALEAYESLGKQTEFSGESRRVTG